MIIAKVSGLTGKYHEREIDITADQLHRYVNGGGCIQDICPHLSADDREYMITGITPEEWDATFPPEED